MSVNLVCKTHNKSVIVRKVREKVGRKAFLNGKAILKDVPANREYLACLSILAL